MSSSEVTRTEYNARDVNYNTRRVEPAVADSGCTHSHLKK